MTGYLLLLQYASIVAMLTQTSALGGIHGVIEYPNRQFAAGVIVVAENLDTGQVWDTKSGSSGAYAFVGLPMGPYRVAVDVERFRPFTREIAVQRPGWSEAVDVHLELIASEQITVIRASPSMVETASDMSLGVRVSRGDLAEMPLPNGRTLQSIVTLVPGIVVTDSVGTLAQFTSTGQRRYANRLTIDGVSADLAVDVIGPGIGQAGSGGLPAFATSGGTQTLVPLAAIEEVAIRTTNATPEHARTPGAQTLIVTRSGGDRVTASAFTDLRPHQLAANSWFANANQAPTQHVGMLDTGVSGGGPLIRGRLYLFGAWERQRIDQSINATIVVPSQAIRARATSLAAQVLNAFPRPNDSETGADQATLSRRVPGTSRLSDVSLRFDAPLGAPLRLFIRINIGESTGRERGSAGQVLAQSSTVTESTALRSVTAGLTGVREAMANELRVNVTTNRGAIELGTSAAGGAKPLPLEPFVLPGLSARDALVNVRLYADAGGSIISGRAGAASQRQLQFVDTWTFVRGRHEWRAGIDYRHVHSAAHAATGQYAYRFNALSDLLAGRVQQTTVNRVLPVQTHRHAMAAFAQDSMHVSRLSLTYGVRYTIQPAPASDTGVEPLLLAYEPLPRIQPLPSGSRLWKTEWTNLAPQIAATWRLRTRQGRETILRAGWGLTFDELTQPGAIALGRGYPYVSTRVINTSTFPLPASELTGPFPTPFDDDDSNTYFALKQDLCAPRTYARQIGLEQALGPSQRIDVSYVGATGRDLIYWSAYPGRSGSLAVINAFSNDASSAYHALLAEYVRRLSRGLQARVAYAWSHAIDTDSGESPTPALPVRLYPASDNRGSADFDRRHVLQVVASYRFPSPTPSSWLRRMAADWQVDVVGSARSGAPVSVTTTLLFGPLPYAVRPDAVEGAPLWLDDDRSPTGQRLNARAFAIQGGDARQGSLGRNTVRSSPLRQLDLSLARSLRFGARVRVQFRVDAFNVFNIPNVGPPAAHLGVGTFGVANKTYAQSLGTGTLAGGGLTPFQQVGDARALQFTVRLGL